MASLFLSGFMGTGKSTLGPLVAARLGLRFVDVDALVASRAGRSAAELLRSDERAFRALEESIVVELASASEGSVVSLGGGSVVSSRARSALLDGGVLVTLRASEATILERTASRVNERPMLAGDPVARIHELLKERSAAYAECHGEVFTDDLDEEQSCDAICSIFNDNPLVVPLGERSYRVHVVHERPEALTDAVARLGPSGVLAVTDSHVVRARGSSLERALGAIATPHRICTLPPGEEHKRLATIDTIWEAAIGQGLDRDGVLVAFGGGVVGDLTGFAASTLFRGVRAVQVPTTLLAMVDASVGGKTGFDLPAGKNLVGSFFQPSAVVVDLAHLSTLPARHRKAGLAEIAKIALLFDATLVDELRARASELVSGPPEGLTSVVRRAIALKARVVSRDETERGERALLNFGHTVGHALEAHGRYTKYLHGEAVALGMIAELEVAFGMGRASKELVTSTRSLLQSLGLPTDVSRAELAASSSYVEVDKKRRHGRLVLPIARAVGEGELLEVTVAQLAAALHS